MGMYTRLNIGLIIGIDSMPLIDRNVLYFLTNNELYDSNLQLPEHPLFAEFSAWRTLGQPHIYANYRQWGADYQNGWFEINTEIKNYFKEIENFLDWLSPYGYYSKGMPDLDYIGWMKYEEAVHPDLIYVDNIENKISIFRTKSAYDENGMPKPFERIIV